MGSNAADGNVAGRDHFEIDGNRHIVNEAEFDASTPPFEHQTLRLCRHILQCRATLRHGAITVTIRCNFRKSVEGAVILGCDVTQTELACAAAIRCHPEIDLQFVDGITEFRQYGITSAMVMERQGL